MKKSSKIYFIWIYGVSWKKERTIWKGIIEKLKNYNPIGAKPEQVDKVFKGNVISEIYKNLWKEQELIECSFSLLTLVQYVIEILKVRKEDIMRRYHVKKALEKARNDIIEKNKQMDEEREQALKEAKEEFYKEHEEEEHEDEEEEGEEGEKKKKKKKNKKPKKPKPVFDEEGFLKAYDEEHPKLEVPEPVVFDIDDDFDVNY